MRKKSFFIAIICISIIILCSCKKEFDLAQKQAYSVSTSSIDINAGPSSILLSKAQKTAQYFLQKKYHNDQIVIKGAFSILKNGIPYFHVFNANKGFVILSPDSLYSPVLAYDSLNNFSFSKNLLNPGLLAWMNKHAHELDFIRNAKTKYADSIGTENKILWRILGGLAPQSQNPITGSSTKKLKYITNTVGVNVPPPTLISSIPISYSTNSAKGPLCKTLWGQDYPFNAMCPAGNYSVNHTPVGCVPVAMAQVMHFFNYPNWYDFSAMPLTKVVTGSMGTGTYPLVQVALLMYSLGLYLQTSYNDNGSGTNIDNIVPTFNLWQYSSASSTASVDQQYWSGEIGGTSYADLLTNELQVYGRPCIVNAFPGQTSVFGWGIFPTPSGAGHTWVCDGSDVTTYYYGYEDTYQAFNGDITTTDYYDSQIKHSMLHMNWGWDDPFSAVQDDQVHNPLTNDGWYNCNINYTQASNASTDFQYFQVIIYNIQR